MNKWRDCTIKNDPSAADNEDLTIRTYYPARRQWRLILGTMVALNIIVTLTIGGLL